MADSESKFWGDRATSATLAEYEQVFEAQRNQIQSLQNQVSGLLHERSFLKASTASDVRNFCLNYLATSGNTGSCLSRSSSTAISDLTRSVSSLARLRRGGGGSLHHGSGGDPEAIPAYDLLMFLHRYSNGLIPAPENKRKRMRSSSVNSVGHTTSTATNSSSATPRMAQRRMFVPYSA